MKHFAFPIFLLAMIPVASYGAVTVTGVPGGMVKSSGTSTVRVATPSATAAAPARSATADATARNSIGKYLGATANQIAPGSSIKVPTSGGGGNCALCGEDIVNNFDTLLGDEISKYISRNFEQIFGDEINKYLSKNFQQIFGDEVKNYIENYVHDNFEQFFDEYITNNYNTSKLKQKILEEIRTYIDSPEFTTKITQKFNTYISSAEFKAAFTTFVNNNFDEIFKSKVVNEINKYITESNEFQTLIDNKIEEYITNNFEKVFKGEINKYIENYINENFEEILSQFFTNNFEDILNNYITNKYSSSLLKQKIIDEMNTYVNSAAFKTAFIAFVNANFDEVFKTKLDAYIEANTTIKNKQDKSTDATAVSGSVAIWGAGGQTVTGKGIATSETDLTAHPDWLIIGNVMKTYVQKYVDENGGGTVSDIGLSAGTAPATVVLTVDGAAKPAVAVPGVVTTSGNQTISGTKDFRGTGNIVYVNSPDLPAAP